MAKKKPSSPRKNGNAKPKYKRVALDDSTSEEALQRAIERQRKAMEAGELEDDPNYPEDPLDPECYLETLMQVPNRLPLEDPGPDEINSSHRLVRFVHDKPAQYKKFLQFMRDGASLGSAVFAANFCNPPLVKRWITMGMQDANNLKDTFHSRLFYDVARTNGTKRAEVEILVAEEDPLKWLERGPGSYIDDQWKAPARALPNQANGQQALPNYNENALSIEASTTKENNDEIEGEIIKAPVDDNAYQRALAILRESNVSPEQQPAGWDKALRTQAGEQLSEEELEVKETEQTSISLGSNEAILTEQQRQAQSSLPS